MSYYALTQDVVRKGVSAMHILKDENGNLIPHGAHEDGHCHEHEHCHEHDHGHCHEGCPGHQEDNGAPKDVRKETLALLAYMQQHNTQHAAELDQMAGRLSELGMEEAAKHIHDAVSDFQKGNMRLSVALSLVKEAVQE